MTTHQTHSRYLHYLGYGGWYDQDVPVLGQDSEDYEAVQRKTMRLVDYAQRLLPDVDIATAAFPAVEAAYRNAFGTLWDAPAKTAIRAWVTRVMP